QTRRLDAIAADAIDVATNRVLQKHPAIWQARFDFVQLGFFDAPQITAMRARADRQFSFRQCIPKTLRLFAEENFLETMLVQVAQFSRAIVIMAIAGQRAVAIDGDVVFGNPGKCAAIKSLSAQTRAPLVLGSKNPTGEITKYPIDSSALRHGMRWSEFMTCAP